MIALGINRTGEPRSRHRKTPLEVVLRLCEQITLFMQQHEGNTSKAYLSREGGLYLVTKAEVYDFELSDHLAEFAAPYIERGILDSVTLLPVSSPEELGAFFDPNSAVRIEIDHA